MNPTRESVFEAALSLSEEDRAALAEALLDSLAPDAGPSDDALAAELEARWADFERSGGEGSIPWDELKNQA